MDKVRTYGNAPFKLVMIHGGPGAPGYMAPVARELSQDRAVLEPLQTATTLTGQLQELKTVLDENAKPPVILIGSSWGAMLGFIFTAYNPNYVDKLILIGSAEYEAQYDNAITQTRLSRLSEDERADACKLLECLSDPQVSDKNPAFTQLVKLFIKTDSFNPMTLDLELLEVQYKLNQSVWHDAEKFRASGKLLALGHKIQCPVVAIHGDYDPHPATGIRNSLTPVLNNFQFILLENCGHYPWIEREAKGKFYAVLKSTCNA